MSFVGNQSTVETITDKKTYTGDGSSTVYGIRYYSTNVDVYLNGIKKRNSVDYTIDTNGTFITFVTAPLNGTYIDLTGINEITDLARSSYTRETFTAIANQTQFGLTNNISGSDKINIYNNGFRLSETDFTIDYVNNTVDLIVASIVDDVVAVEIIMPGFRSANHNSRAEKAYHPMFSTPNIINNNINIPSDENAMMIGPLTINSTITINGTLTIV
tara:strand:- start:2548 stop:3195 length:648 start_codon:yes stop_codon:yes gene_type:complete